MKHTKKTMVDIGYEITSDWDQDQRGVTIQWEIGIHGVFFWGWWSIKVQSPGMDFAAAPCVEMLGLLAGNMAVTWKIYNNSRDISGNRL